MLDRVAALTWTRPKLVLAVVAAIALIAGAVGRDVEKHLKAAGFTDSASESERATKLLRDSVGYDPNPGIVLLVRARDGGRLDLRSPAVRREVGRVSDGLARAKHVGRVVNPLEDRREGAELIARDGRSLVISGNLAAQDVEDLGGEAAEDAKPRIGSKLLDVSMGGFAPSFNEVNDQTREDLTNAELIAFPALTVLLLLVFRGVVAAAIPLLIGGLSIAGTFLVLRTMAALVDTSVFALNLATALSLGLAVDYALLMVSRYREELERDGPTREAHRRTVATAGRAALFSGVTVAVAMAALVVLPQRFLYSIGVAGATVGLLSALITLFVVPSLLSLAVALASSALLLATASPLLWSTLTGPSAEVVPPSLPSYETNEYVESHYPRSITEAVTVTVRGETTGGALAAFNRKLMKIDGVDRGAPFE